MTQTINDIEPTRPYGCQIAIDFTPKGLAYTYTAGVTTYNPANTYWASASVPLTLTYTATLSDSTASIVEAHWDLGDGTKAFGQSVTHTYRVPNSLQVSLQLKDNYGNFYAARKLLPVRADPQVVLIPAIGVAI